MLYPKKPKGIKKFVGNIKQAIKERKKGVTIEGIRLAKKIDNIGEVPEESIQYIDNTDEKTGEIIKVPVIYFYADYELIPMPKSNVIYRVEEKIMSEKSYQRKLAAREMKNIDSQKYLSEKPVNIQKSRIMYMTANYSVIKQLKEESGINEHGIATQQLEGLVERQRVKKRIQESGDKIARAIYENGRATDPRTLGYIGGLIKVKGKVKRTYDLTDSRAKLINEDIFNSFLKSSKKLRDENDGR